MNRHKVCNGVHLRQDVDRPVFSDMVSEEVNGGLPELALGRVDNQALLAEQLEESPEVRHILCPGGAANRDVVQI